MNEMTFLAQRISNKKNILFPDKIIVDDENVTYYKGKLIGYLKTLVSRKSIASITISEGVLFSEIIIESLGGNKIYASGFLKSDARKIKESLI
jgi:hypothetical protein